MAFLSATIEKTGNTYTGWLDDIKGVIAQGDSIEEVKTDLINLYQIKKDAEKKQRNILPCNHNNIFHEEIPMQFTF